MYQDPYKHYKCDFRHNKIHPKGKKNFWIFIKKRKQVCEFHFLKWLNIEVYIFFFNMQKIFEIQKWVANSILHLRTLLNNNCFPSDTRTYRSSHLIHSQCATTPPHFWFPLLHGNKGRGAKIFCFNKSLSATHVASQQGSTVPRPFNHSNHKISGPPGMLPYKPIKRAPRRCSPRLATVAWAAADFGKHPMGVPRSQIWGARSVAVHGVCVCVCARRGRFYRVGCQHQSLFGGRGAKKGESKGILKNLKPKSRQNNKKNISSLKAKPSLVVSKTCWNFRYK